MIAGTPLTPYYCVIFTSIQDIDLDGYEKMAAKMIALASNQEGFLGIESARENIGITVSYWKDLESIRKWKENVDHIVAQNLGKTKWYKQYKTRIAKVERDYGFVK